jgi:hypothetical protein
MTMGRCHDHHSCDSIHDTTNQLRGLARLLPVTDTNARVSLIRGGVDRQVQTPQRPRLTRRSASRSAASPTSISPI